MESKKGFLRGGKREDMWLPGDITKAILSPVCSVAGIFDLNQPFLTYGPWTTSGPREGFRWSAREKVYQMIKDQLARDKLMSMGTA
ncbi:hypothetical protein M8J77_010583 [Diaphorina citri]|nr:hypothetical protein M8J77_010583 [Diaphorina citri]